MVVDVVVVVVVVVMVVKIYKEFHFATIYTLINLPKRNISYVQVQFDQRKTHSKELLQNILQRHCRSKNREKNKGTQKELTTRL